MGTAYGLPIHPDQAAAGVRLVEGVTCTAAELHGQYIGEVIRFEWHFPHSRVIAQVLGELRQISHTENSVNICLAGHLGDGTDITEFDLEPGETIQFMEVK